MKLHRTARYATLRGLAIAVLVLPVLAGCGSDDDSATTLAPATTGATSSTEASADMASNIESLSYLMQGLLTTPQIGGGWVDMGRVVVPPGQEPGSADLCPEGQAIAEPIGTTMNAQVQTTYQRVDGTQAEAAADASGSPVNPSLLGGMVMEYLLWNERQQVDEAFAELAAATEACIGTEWADPNMGDTVMTSFDAPALGTSSFAAGYRPVTPPSSDPWAETQWISILMSDPSSPASVVIGVSMTVVHNNPDEEVAALDTDELIRIAEAAVARIMEGL